MNWRSTNREPDARVTAFNRSGTMNQRGLGGGGGLKDYFNLTGTYQKDGDNYYFTNPINSLRARIIDTCVSNFDGIDDFVSIPTSVSFNIGDTVELELNLTNVGPTSAYFIGGETSGSGIRYNTTDGFLVFSGPSSGLRNIAYSKTGNIINLKIKRITLIDYEIYVNDEYLGITGSENTSTILINQIGRRDTGSYFPGVISKVKIYNNTTIKILYYFNHQAGTKIYDLSGSNHGIVYNSTSSIYWVKSNYEPSYLNGCTIYSNGTNYIVVNGNNNYTISNYPKVGYFEAPFLIPKGVITKLVIPIDAKLNNYLPDGNYGFTELNALTATENIIIEKTENIINSLTVKI